MANQEHLTIIEQGPAYGAWNLWRQEHPDVIPDLSNAELRGTNLSSANLDHTNLSGANLVHTNLSGADLDYTNLSGACLHRANLNEANLYHANLSSADLSFANLSYANLHGANLNHADLSFTNLSGAKLHGANLSYAQVLRTIFGNLNLRTINGLETLKHLGPSTIGIDTIYRSGGNIPESFLQGAGINNTFTTYMHSLVDKPINYNSCFISYCSKDQEFADKLYTDLQKKNVCCWYASEDMKTGDKIRPRIYEQVWFNDKLLLILSTSSITSKWVDYEIETALARERKEERNILFPIRLDDTVKESKVAWATYIQDVRHITDFTRWKEHDEYQKGLNRLLRDLKQESVADDGLLGPSTQFTTLRE